MISKKYSAYFNANVEYRKSIDCLYDKKRSLVNVVFFKLPYCIGMDVICVICDVLTLFLGGIKTFFIISFRALIIALYDSVS